VLGLDRVGVTDDFFRIGGNSILAIQVSSLMSESLDFDINVADMFYLKTIRALIQKITIALKNANNIEWDV
ncbi:phosphopantetheine-binding protein, partial [uncultured Aquimarina sp.]|uniref:phosphopantetheine-binding protein n=1 Tax=uncultured Aquimarina sp. TaxID=575652 RepID=UPI00262DF31F